MNTYTLVSLAAYFLLMIAIGIYAWAKTRADSSGYLLAGRGLGPAVTALSAGASDMSGWLLLGLPGALFASIVLYISIPLFLFALFKWAGTREYDVPVAHHHLTKYDNGFMGMAWFIISEVGLFGVLIAGYVYLRVIGAAEPPALRPAIWLAALNTLILVASSFVIHRAEQDNHHGKLTRFRLGLFITLLLGAVFMIFQVYEFTLFGVESDWKQNLWQACFFIIVGLHGLHILIGGTGVALPFYQAMTGKMDKYNHGSITPASLYWHLVDVVWLLIVAIFYAW